MITGEANEPPAVLYGAANLPLVVSFDGPLKKDGAVAIQGADVRLHPFVANALIITPSSSLAAAQGPVPVLVPLADGVVALTLAFSPERIDTSVRIVRRANPARPVATEGELKELASVALKTGLATGTCAKAGAADIPREVIQHPGSGSRDSLVCGGGAFAYMRVEVKTDCTVKTARLTRGEESADVLLLQQSSAQCISGTCWLVVARVPPSDGLGFELELLAHNGVLCRRTVVDLKPHSP